MNWLDFAIIITLAVGALLGIRIGIIRAGFAAAGVIFGIVMLGQVTRYASIWFGGHVEAEAIIKVVAYGITIVLSVAIAAAGSMLARRRIYALFLEWTDRLAGLALGLVVAVGISAAVIVTMTNLAEDDVEAPEGQKETVWESTWRDFGLKESLANSLVESSLVPALSVVVDSVPGNLDFIPANFRIAVDNLRKIPETT